MTSSNASPESKIFGLAVARHIAIIATIPFIFAATSVPALSKISSMVDFFRFFSLVVSIAELAFIARCSSVGLVFVPPLRRADTLTKVSLIIISLVAVGTTIFIATEQVSATVRTIAWFIHLLFGLTIAGVTMKIWPDRDRAIWQWILLGLVAHIVFISIFVATIADPLHFPWMDFSVSVISVRQLGFYSAAGFSIAIGLAIYEQNNMRRWMICAAAALAIALSFWSGTRSSVLSSVAALAAILLISSEARTKRSMATIAIALLTGAALSLIYVAPEPDMGLKRIFVSLVASDANHVASGRLEVWKSTSKAIMKRPAFGYGESQFRLTEPTAHGNINHPHNFFLQFLYQWGFIGGGCFIFLIARLYWKIVIATRRHPETCLPGFMLVTNMLAMSQIEGSFYHPFPVMMSVFGLAFTLAMHDEPVNSDSV
jgi:O-antigen ligase